MPYTPPSQQSPAASQVPSPAHSRSASYMESSISSPPRSPGPNSQLPRSSSQSYFHRPRRGPSHLGHGELSPLPDRGEPADKPGLMINTNIRQSPPPQSDALMPPGAMISPPESAQNSSDEEDATNADKTQAEQEKLSELEQAVRQSITVSRNGSPPRPNESPEQQAEHNLATNQIITSPMTSPPRLSEGQRKISHSRSSSEIVLSLSTSEQLPSSSAASDGSSDEEGELLIKPPLVRKKSGELVKPAIRPRRRKHASMPGTPTYSKAVHFDEEIAQVRHFLQVDRPIAVSAGTSPVESLDDHDEYPFGTDNDGRASEFEIRLPNFPRESLERQAQLVRLESLHLSSDRKSLVGSVAVANVAFHKHVATRFTFDYWKTTSEVIAEYSNDPRKQERTDGYDVFAFSIKLTDQSNVGHKTLLLCVRYLVNNNEHWDNNNSMNFQVDFAKVNKTAAAVSGPGSNMPRSRRNSLARRHGRPSSLPNSLEDDFGARLDNEKGFEFRSKLANKKATLLPDTPPARRVNVGGQQFSNRYDFGASLSAALSQAQAALGDRSGIKPRRNPQTEASKPAVAPPSLPSSMSRVSQPSASGTDSPRHDSLLANKQSVDSRAYQEFISKFCFFGSGSKGSPPASSTNLYGSALNKDGANEQDGFFGSGPGPEISDDKESNAVYGSHPHLVSGHANLISSPQVLSPEESNPGSPDPYPNSQDQSPMNFGYPYSHENRNGFWSGSVTPPAIRS